jgi:hypothetical protein
MKKIIFTLTLIFNLTILFAQTWAPTGATWHYSFMQMFSYGYVKIVSITDTTILGNDCKILQKTQFGYSSPGVYDTVNLGKEFTYLDTNSNIVYRYFNNKFDTLYNFNALIGDKWTVHGIHGTSDSGIVVVDSIGYRVINSDSLKSIFVSTISGSCIGWYSSEIVERIGCIAEYMFPNYVSCIVDLGEGGALRCYTDNNFPVYTTGEASYCDFITSIDSYLILKDFIEVYPNPAIDRVTINYAKRQDLKIQVYNMIGECVLQSFLTGNTNNIDIRTLEKGMYLIKLSGKDWTIQRKLVKE